MRYRKGRIFALLCLAVTTLAMGTTLQRYYAHPAVVDSHGVIAPWYQGQNGQLDLRVRIAAETMKRYPWTDTKKAVAAAPEYVFNSRWNIAPDGTITIPPLDDWLNGDSGQRAAYVLSSWVDYYRYSGDPAAIAHMTLMANFLLDRCLRRPPPLARVPGERPNERRKPYGQADPRGMIELDIVAEAGLALLRAWQVTGEERWLAACRHWGDLLASHRTTGPGLAPVESLCESTGCSMGRPT